MMQREELFCGYKICLGGILSILWINTTHTQRTACVPSWNESTQPTSHVLDRPQEQVLNACICLFLVATSCMYKHQVETGISVHIWAQDLKKKRTGSGNAPIPVVTTGSIKAAVPIYQALK